MILLIYDLFNPKIGFLCVGDLVIPVDIEWEVDSDA